MENLVKSPVNINYKGVEKFIDTPKFTSVINEALNSYETLISKNGEGADFLGWLDLPSKINSDEIACYQSIADQWRSRVDCVVVVGIGGSYLGAKASLNALLHSFGCKKDGTDWPEILFAGHNMSEEYMAELLDYLQDRTFAIIVISKSGTTTEPAVAFRILKQYFESRFGKELSKERIVAITDSSRGALKEVADREGYRKFVIPDDVGGRFSVLTPVGLLPLAVAGIDVKLLIEGAVAMKNECYKKSSVNPAIVYSALRNYLYRSGKTTEIFVSYTPKLQYFAEWWKQLFGESEGKNGKGIFPASVGFTTDLHSMGQYIQDGLRNIFETTLKVNSSLREVLIPYDKTDADGLNFISGKRVEECNHNAHLGTLLAHIDGGVPNITIEIDTLNEYSIGALFYFFEFSCGISAYTLGVNPFDQPGVEDYKKNMFALLGKPGYEDLADEISRRNS